jgi:hypothetical protein
MLQKIAEFRAILEEALAKRADPEQIRVYTAPVINYSDSPLGDPVFLVERIEEMKAGDAKKRRLTKDRSGGIITPKKAKTSASKKKRPGTGIGKGM